MKYYYAEDPENPQRKVTLAYHEQCGLISFGWSCNRPTEVKEILAELDTPAVYARAKYLAKGDQFSKRMGRKVAETRLETHPIHIYQKMAPGEGPIEKILCTLVMAERWRWCTDKGSVERVDSLMDVDFLQRTFHHHLHRFNPDYHLLEPTPKKMLAEVMFGCRRGSLRPYDALRKEEGLPALDRGTAALAALDRGAIALEKAPRNEVTGGVLGDTTDEVME